MSEFQPDPKIVYFISRLERLDPGGAKLKRSAGEMLGEAREVAFFYSLLPNGVQEKHEGIYFLAATLFPLAEGGGGGDMGASVRRARNDKNAKGLDRRVQALLDADEAQLPYRLRRAIFILKSNHVSRKLGMSASRPAAVECFHSLCSAPMGAFLFWGITPINERRISHVDSIPYPTELCPFQPQSGRYRCTQRRHVRWFPPWAGFVIPQAQYSTVGGIQGSL